MQKELQDILKDYSVLKVAVFDGKKFSKSLLAPIVKFHNVEIEFIGMNVSVDIRHSIKYTDISKLYVLQGEFLKILKIIMKDNSYVLVYMLPILN